jgi:hypothetical protein
MSKHPLPKFTPTEMGYHAGMLARVELSVDRNGKAWFKNPTNQRIFVGYDLATGKRLEGWV